MNNYQHIIAEFTLITGTKGAFEFKVDGETLFSKKNLGRHAEPGEILQIFKEQIAPDIDPYPQK